MVIHISSHLAGMYVRNLTGGTSRNFAPYKTIRFTIVTFTRPTAQEVRQLYFVRPAAVHPTTLIHAPTQPRPKSSRNTHKLLCALTKRFPFTYKCTTSHPPRNKPPLHINPPNKFSYGLQRHESRYCETTTIRNEERDTRKGSAGYTTDLRHVATLIQTRRTQTQTTRRRPLPTILHTRHLVI